MHKRLLAMVLFGVAAAGAAWAAGNALPSLPQEAKEKHLGNVTCGNAFCHEAQERWKISAVLQNEVEFWEAHDPHAKAYKSLQGEKAREIARKLGIDDATRADACLDCHANNVPVEYRERTFDIADGVSCEACHGPARRWLGVHVLLSGLHEDNVAAGMYPTEEPLARAELCLSCHAGTSRKFVSHALYGAGHPRTPFELDTFTNAPAHFVADDVYAQRKRVADGLQTWAIGQLVALRHDLDGIADAQRFRVGLFPELAFFDCYGCHRPMSAAKQRSEPRVTLPTPRISTVNAIMLAALLGDVDRPLVERLDRQADELQAAARQGYEATQKAALVLRATTVTVAETLATRTFSPADLPTMLASLSRGVDRIADLQPPVAEQAVLASSSLVASMRRAGLLEAGRDERMKAAIAALYAEAGREPFRPAAFRAALHELAETR